MKKQIRNKFSKKWFIGVSLVSSFSAISLVTVSCSSINTAVTSKSGMSWQFDSHRTVQSLEVTESGTSFLKEFASYAFNTPLNAISRANSDSVSEAVNSMSLSFFRIVQPKDDEYTFDSKGRVNGVDTHRLSELRFEIIKSLTFEFGNGSKVTFDQDTPADPNHKIMTINDDYLLQSKVFDVATSNGGLVNVNFALRDDVQQHHWIQQLSGKKLSPISADDLWRGAILYIASYGKVRSQLTNLPQLSDKKNPSAVSIEEIDNAVNSYVTSQIPGYTAAVATGNAQSNDGMFFSPSYDLDNVIYQKSISDPAVRKQIVPDATHFNLKFAKNNTLDKISLTNAWNSLFKRGSIFAAVSNEEIEKIIASRSDLLKTITAQSKTKNPLDYQKFIDSDVFKSGYYQWILTPPENQFVAGKYYFSTSTRQRWIAEQNDDYVDSRWNNQTNAEGQKTTIKEYIVKTIQKSETSDIATGNEYVIGTNAVAGLASFTPAAQLDVLKNSRNWGLRFIRGYTSDKQTGDYSYFSGNPFLVKDDASIYYNNNFAKALYGNTLQNYWKTAKDSLTNSNISDKNGSDFYQYQTTGYGVQFKTNLASLLNGTAFIKTLSPSTMNWPWAFSPDGQIGKDANGNDVNLSQTIAAEGGVTNNGVSDEDVVSYSVSKVQSDGTIKSYPISAHSYLVTANSPLNQKFGPPREPDSSLPINNKTGNHYSPFEFIQENIKEVLDHANIGSNEKAIFEMPYARGLAGKGYNDSYKDFAELVQEIDPRLEVVPAVHPATFGDVSSDATVDTNAEWNDDFNADPSLPTTNSPNPYSFVNRLWQGDKGVNIAPLNLASSYGIDDPIYPILTNLGYLQSGIVMSFSYLYDQVHSGKTTWQGLGGTYSKFEDIIEFLHSRFENYKTSLNNTLAGFLSSKDQQFIDDVKSDLTAFKFEDFYKSNLFLILKYDFLGFKGLEKIQKWSDDLDTSVKTLDAKQHQNGSLSPSELADLAEIRLKQADIRTIQGKVISGFFVNAAESFALEPKYQSYTTQQKIDLMSAYGAVYMRQFQPFVSNVGDRRYLSPSIRKIWYTPSNAVAGNMDLSRERVDLDHVDNDYLKPVVIPGGIVY